MMKRFGNGITLVFAVSILSACSTGEVRILSGFGALNDPEGKYRSRGPHVGVDVWGYPSSAVIASADGRVVEVGEEQGESCGKYVLIQHVEEIVINGISQSVSTRYCHLQEQLVAAENTVRRGQVIGAIGTTGWKQSPVRVSGFEHVHWEMLVSARKRDPLPFTIGCYDQKQTYPTGHFILTYPVQCKN